MAERSFEYDVAISFLDRDAPVADELADALRDRMQVFVYSEAQAELAGKDGQVVLTRVFGEQARVVVVFYRVGWGETPWTRIEATAIQNRAFGKGLDFTVFIPLDQTPSVPEWVPRVRVWMDLERWGINGVAAVVEARVRELGGTPRQETVEDRAARLGRRKERQERRNSFLNSSSAVEAAKVATSRIGVAVVARCQAISAANSGLQVQATADEFGCLIRGHGRSVRVSLNLAYSNTLADASLTMDLARGPLGVYEQIVSGGSAQRIEKRRYLPDVDARDALCWKPEFGEGRTLSEDAVIDEAIDLLLQDVAKDLEMEV